MIVLCRAGSPLMLRLHGYVSCAATRPGPGAPLGIPVVVLHPMDVPCCDRLLHWLGFREITAVMRRLDVLVMPSRNEGFRLVLAEATAAGTALVPSNATNFPKLVGGVEGRFF